MDIRQFHWLIHLIAQKGYVYVTKIINNPSCELCVIEVRFIGLEI